MLSTPAVRHFAKQNNVDIREVAGTGPHGRVVREDILNFINQPQAAAAAQAGFVPGGYQNLQQPPLTGVQDYDEVTKITGIRKAMVKTMTQALNIPFFTLSDDVDATKLLKMRQELKVNVPGLTVLPFFVKAISLAMFEYPEINAIINPDLDAEGYIHEYVIKKNHNFSVAIDSNLGLTTPVIKQIEEKSILDINSDIRNMIDRVKNNQLTADDFQDGTFSVSSVGNIGGRYFVPTILRPQAAIIAIGKAFEAPRYKGQSETGQYLWEPCQKLSFSISADHRVLDGATVARFSGALKKYIENPNLMLISI